ncbi:MAG: hypothetical protein CMO80_04880 [Verrucomicrobiales bacterium]|nr:hypothetical protein [Verrucomicrobiales bacterium]|tara:strand:+ start:7614 stop:8612 length:999 start_codon:yes stop_codon:yes gene_type:complete
MKPTKVHWETLERLRETFLAAKPNAPDYWKRMEDLRDYDRTFGLRIAWKWDAVLNELKRLRWEPPGGDWLDWGCGSGIATRRALGAFGCEGVREVGLFDRSSRAVRFSGDEARKAFPRVTFRELRANALPPRKPVGLLLISHVLNELDEERRATLVRLVRRAKSVIWVEPGSKIEARALSGVRDELLNEFNAVAPCTHSGPCGMLTRGNERHWCHFFARPPEGVRADAEWQEFSRRLGIDLRSAPFSYLVMENKRLKREPVSQRNETRVIGRPRVYKATLKVMGCNADELEDREAQKRDVPDFYKSCKKESQGTLYRFGLAAERIKTVEELD